MGWRGGGGISAISRNRYDYFLRPGSSLSSRCVRKEAGAREKDRFVEIKSRVESSSRLSLPPASSPLSAL